MRRKIAASLVLAVFTLFSSMCCVYADEDQLTANEELLKELRDLRIIIQAQDARIEELERKVSAQSKAIESRSPSEGREDAGDVSGRLKHELERLRDIGGIEIGAGLTFVGQGTPNANNAGNTDGEDSRFDGSWSAEIELAKSFGDTGMAYMLLEAGQGDAIESELLVFSNVNSDAMASGARVEISEAWYEQHIFDRQFTVTAGKIDATNYIDTNEFANDETTQFLGGIFRNSAVIDWPDGNAFGMRAYLSPSCVEFLDAGVVYMDERGDWENLFDNPFIAAQLNFMPAAAFGYDDELWAGNYRVLFWYNGSAHARVNDPDVIERGSAGFGISCDQRITDSFGVFGRFGFADPVTSDLGYDWSLGGQIAGKLWGRENDVIAAAIGQAIPGKEYSDANEFHRTETHVETYYSLKVSDHLTISPDIQLIWDPNGGGTIVGKDRDAIFVYGVRGQVDF
jgi:carbohydrate-selective porin OprB